MVDEVRIRAQALERALATPDGRAATALLAAAEVAIVAPPDFPLLQALAPFLERLLEHGARPGRLALVLESPDGAPVGAGIVVSVGIRVPGLRVHAHDPARATWFPVCPGDVVIEIDDVLRESEVVVLAGLAGPGDRASLTRLLVPGLAPPALREPGRAAEWTTLAERVAVALPVEPVIAFDPQDPERAYCGSLGRLADVAAWS